MEAWLTFSTIALGFMVVNTLMYGSIVVETLLGRFFRESKTMAAGTVLVQAYTLAALSAIPAWLIYLK